MAEPNDLPCCDPVSPENVNRWFDYWLLKEQRETSRAGSMCETIERLRKCALEGTRKAKRNKKQMRALVAKKLREVAEEMEREDE